MFSYVAAGRQDQKKGGPDAVKTQSKPNSTKPEIKPTTTTAVPPRSPVVGMHQMQSPLLDGGVTTTITHVQPQPHPDKRQQDAEADKAHVNISRTVNQQVPVGSSNSPAAATPVTQKVTTPPSEPPPTNPFVDCVEKSAEKLPQVPPRVQSQGSVNRGPPPAIPPRPQAVLQRAGTVQAQQKTPMARGQLTRQQSATSVPPAYTPQPPPKFVIPQRQNSKTSLSRQQSNTSGGAPQSPKRN